MTITDKPIMKAADITAKTYATQQANIDIY